MLDDIRVHLLPRPEATAAYAVAPTCANCGAVLGGRYCSACGQPVLPDRLTGRESVRRLATGAFDLDRGILRTVTDLFRCPGAVARDYVRGRTIPYANPIKYFVLVVSLVQIVALWAGGCR